MPSNSFLFVRRLGLIGSCLLPSVVVAQIGSTPVVSTRFSATADAIDWTRYQHVDECHHVVTRVMNSTEPLDPDNIARFSFRDTVASAAVQAARRCLHTFSFAKAEVLDLPIYLALAVTAVDTATVQAIVARQLATVDPSQSPAPASAPVRARAKFYLAAIQELMAARPAQIPLAKQLTASLDALGPNALWERKIAHNLLLEPVILSEDLNAVIAGYAELEQLTKQPPSPSFLAIEASSWKFYEGWYQSRKDQALYFQTGDEKAWARWVAYEQSNSIGPERKLLGREAPRLLGEYRYDPQHPGVAPDLPARGEVSLIMTVPAPIINVFWAMPELRRLHQEFPALRIIFVTSTAGAYFNRGPLLPAQEVDSIRHYVFDIVHLPVALSVTSSQFVQLPPPDNRVLSKVTADEMNYVQFSGLVHVFMVDRQGRIVFDGNLGHGLIKEGRNSRDEESEMDLRHVVQVLLK